MFPAWVVKSTDLKFFGLCLCMVMFGLNVWEWGEVMAIKGVNILEDALCAW